MTISEKILTFLQDNKGSLFDADTIKERCDISRTDVASKMARGLHSKYPDMVTKEKREKKVVFGILSGVSNDDITVFKVKTDKVKTTKSKSKTIKKKRVKKEPVVLANKYPIIEMDPVGLDLNTVFYMQQQMCRKKLFKYGILERDTQKIVIPAEYELVDLLKRQEQMQKIAFLLD